MVITATTTTTTTVRVTVEGADAAGTTTTTTTPAMAAVADAAGTTIAMTTESPRGVPVLGVAGALFCVVLIYLALQVRAGEDPAIGAGHAAAVAPAPRQVVVRRVIVTHVIEGGGTSGGVAPAAAPSAAPAPAPAAAPAPAPAPVVSGAS